MAIKHLRTLTLAGTFVLGTAALAFAAGTGGGSGGGSGSGSHTTTTSPSTTTTSPSTSSTISPSTSSTTTPSTNTMGGTRNSDEMEGTGLENAEKHGGKRGMKMKKHGEAFEREDENEKDDLDTKGN